MEDPMSDSLNLLAKIAGTVIFVVAAMVPLTETAAGVAHAEPVCLAPQHNDPWIGCIG
jgi:hypothetical protein